MDKDKSKEATEVLQAISSYQDKFNIFLEGVLKSYTVAFEEIKKQKNDKKS